MLSSGVPGLDSVMAGGYPQNHVFLIEGDSGTGKTTLALQFLLDGVRRGERGLYITRGLLDGRAQLHLDSTES